MIRLKKIKATNIFAFKELEFNFESCLAQIQGKNGFGKSSIFLILQQGLFNRNSKGISIEKCSNDVTGQPYCIEIWFEKDSDGYHIKNSREPNKIEIRKNSHNISAKSIPQNLKLIEEILGTNFDTFCTLTYQEATSTLDLVEDAKDSARKEFCNSALKFSELDELQRKFEDKRKQLSGKNGQVELLRKQIDTLESSLAEEQEAEPEKLQEEQQAKILTEKLQINLADVKEQYQSYLSELKQVNSMLQEVENEKDTLEQRQEIEAQIKNIQLPEETREEIEAGITECEKIHAAASERAKSLEKERDKLIKASDEEICPTCGHEVDVAIIEKEISDIVALLTMLTGNINVNKIQLDQLKKDLQCWIECDRLNQKLNRLKLESKTLGYDVGELQSRQESLAVQKNELFTNVEQMNKELYSSQNALKEYQDFNLRQRTIRELNQKISQNNQKIRLQIDANKKELGELESKLELIELWLKLLGSKGYRVVKMHGFLRQLNVVMAKYSAMLSDGRISCKFFVDENGKIDFKVQDVDKSLPFVNWSAGEKSRVKLACLFAVLEVLEVVGNCSFNVLCLDEVAVSLDSDGKDGLYKVLEYLKSSGKAIYVISHSELFNSAFFDKTITVTKENGISHLC